MEQRYLDDFPIGEKFSSASKTLGDAHFILFGGLTGDTHPIHSDVEYAKARDLPGPLAHGLLLMAMTAFGAAPDARAIHDSVIAMVGTEARFLKPAIVGDTIYPEFEVAAIEPKGKERGILRLRCRIYNQRRDLLLDGEHVLLLKRRPGGSGHAATQESGGNNGSHR